MQVHHIGSRLVECNMRTALDASVLVNPSAPAGGSADTSCGRGSQGQGHSPCDAKCNDADLHKQALAVPENVNMRL